MEDNIHPATIASVFYNRADWHTLIQFLSPHLREGIDSKTVKAYYLHLNRHRGDHISLIIHLASDQSMLNDMFSDLIRNFLERHPSACESVHYPINDFFMPYPNNSVWINHNKHRKVFYTAETKPVEDIRMHISTALIAAVGDEEISLETVVTFSLYMHLGMIHAITDNMAEAQQFIKEIIYGNQPDSRVDEYNIAEKDDAWRFFQQLFDENQSVLIQIVDDVWNGSTDVPPWLASWKVNCKRILDVEDSRSEFLKLSGLIAGQVNFLSRVSLSLLTLKLILKVFLR